MNQPVEISFFKFRVESPLVKRVQVMDNMHELSAIKYTRIFTHLYIGTDEPTHPIISGDDRWKNFQLAEGLKSSQSKKY